MSDTGTLEVRMGDVGSDGRKLVLVVSENAALRLAINSQRALRVVRRLTAEASLAFITAQAYASYRS